MCYAAKENPAFAGLVLLPIRTRPLSVGLDFLNPVKHFEQFEDQLATLHV